MIGKQIDREDAQKILTELKNKNYATQHYV